MSVINFELGSSSQSLPSSAPAPDSGGGVDLSSDSLFEVEIDSEEVYLPSGSPSGSVPDFFYLRL